jgi:hypothetical protein
MARHGKNLFWLFICISDKLLYSERPITGLVRILNAKTKCSGNKIPFQNRTNMSGFGMVQRVLPLSFKNLTANRIGPTSIDCFIQQKNIFITFYI